MLYYMSAIELQADKLSRKTDKQTVNKMTSLLDIVMCIFHCFLFFFF